MTYLERVFKGGTFNKRRAPWSAALFLGFLFLAGALYAFADTATSNPVTVYVKPSVSCFLVPTSASPRVGDTVTFRAEVAPPEPASSNPSLTDTYTFVWSGSDGISGTGVTATHSYSTSGTKTATVTVTPLKTIVAPIDPALLAKKATCLFSVAPLPNLKANAPVLSGAKVGADYVARQPVALSGSIYNVNDARGGATINTLRADFYNRFEWAFRSVPPNNNGWTAFPANISLVTPTLLQPNGAAHTVQSLTWGENGDIAPGGPWYFRLCADQSATPNSRVGIESESNENDNCSAVFGPVTFRDVPRPRVDLLFGDTLQGIGGKTLVEYGGGDYMTWKTWDVPFGPTVCSASNTKGNTTWTGANSKPNIERGFDASTNGYNINDKLAYGITTKTDFTLLCPGLTASVGTTSDTVTILPLSVSCSANVTSALVGQPVTWTADIKKDPTIAHTLSWTLTPTYALVSGNMLTENPVSVTYSDTGGKRASVTVTTEGLSRTANCSTEVTVVAKPKLTVRSTRDGVAFAGAVITQRGGTPTGLGDTTVTAGANAEYIKETDVAIQNVTLQAPPILGEGRFKEWTCTGGTPNPVARTCTISVAPGASAVITANYHRPDLVAGALTVTGLPVVGGQTLTGTATLSGKVYNQSTHIGTETGAFPNQYFYQKNGGAWIEIATPQLTDRTPLPAGMNLDTARAVADASLDISPLGPGEYRFRLCADRPPENGIVPETDELNNCTETPSPTAPAIRILGRPDLVYGALTVTGTNQVPGVANQYYHDTTLTLKDATLKNTGNAPAVIGAPYRTLYEYSLNGGAWMSFVEKNLSDQNDLLTNISRPVPEHSWGSIAPSATNRWRFRYCVDQNSAVGTGYSPAFGTVAEYNPNTTVPPAESEASNCSPASPEVTVVERPIPKINLVIDKSPIDEIDNRPTEPDTVTVGYNTLHTLRWKGTGIKAGTCKSSVAAPFTSFAVANGIAENTTGVSTGALVNEQYQYKIECESLPGALVSSVNDTVVVNVKLPEAEPEGGPTCSASPNTASNPFVGQTVTWTASWPTTAPVGVTYSWTGTDFSPATKTGNGVTQTYTNVTVNPEVATFTATLPGTGNRTLSPISCTVTIKTAPDLTATSPTPSATSLSVGDTVTLSGATVKNEGTADAPITPEYRNRYQYQFKPAQGSGPATTWGDWTNLNPSVPFTVMSSPLSIGATRVVGNSNMTLNAPGEYRYQVCADDEDLIKERNLAGNAEANNCSDPAEARTVTAVYKNASVDLVVDASALPVDGNDNQTTQPDTITVPYNTLHTLRWKGNNLASCTSTGQTAFTTGNAIENSSGLSTGALTSTQYIYTITCDAVANARPTSVTDTVTVNVIAPSMTCSASPDTATEPFQGATVTWTASAPNGTTGYSWSNLTTTYSLTESTTLSSNPLRVIYSNGGLKSATVSATAPGNRALSATCTVTIKTAPDLTATSPTPSATSLSVGDTVTLFGATVKNEGTADAVITSEYRNRYQYQFKPAQGFGLPTSWGTWTNLNPSVPFTVMSSPLSIGATRVVGNSNMTLNAPGEYRYQVCADDEDLIKERNLAGNAEANNCSTPASVIVTAVYKPIALDLTVRKNGVGTFVNAITVDYRDLVELQWTGQNLGACTASTVTTPSAAGTANWTDTKTTPPPTQTEGNIGPMLNASYTYTITCKPGAFTGVTADRTASVTVTVNPPPPPSCSASPNTATEPFLGTEVTWTAAGTLASDVLSWTGTDFSPATKTGNDVTQTYTNVTVNPKEATVTATAPGNRVRTAKCSVTVKTGPDLTASVTVTGTKPIAGETDTYYDDGTITLGGTLTNIGTAPTTNGMFFNLYQYKIGNGPWVDLDAIGLVTGSAVQPGTGGARPVNPSSVLRPSGTSIGVSYTYRLCADQDTHSGLDKSYVPSAVVAEDNITRTAETEASNCAQKTVILKSFPDLVISRDPAPVQTGTLTDGQIYTFNGEVKNAGNYLVPSSPSFLNRFQIVKSADAGGGTVTLPNSPTISGLGVNAVQTVFSGNWTGIAGRHALTLCADRSDTLDDNNKVVESDETNNCSPATVTIDVYPGTPGVSARKGDCPANGRITLEYAPASGAQTYELYRKDPDSQIFVFQEAAGENISGQNGLRGQDDVPVSGGTYSYYVKAIGADGLSMQSPTSSAVSSSGCTNPLPDLVATSIVPNGTLTVGSAITFTGIVKNSGGADVAPGTTFQNSFTLTGPGTPPTFPAVQISGLVVDDGVPPPETKPATSATWTAVAGTYTIKFCADSSNVIAETAGTDNDTSNCKDTVFTVSSGATTRTLTVNVVGNGTVTGTGDINCVETNPPTPCETIFPEGTPVTLTETPSTVPPGPATFSGWSGDGTGEVTATTRTVVMDANKNVTATFTGGTPPGTGSGTNPTVTCSASPSQNVIQNVTAVSWNAYPAGGSGLYRQFVYEFDNDNLPSGNPDYEDNNNETEVRETPSSQGYSYEKIYPTTGTKRARVKVIDSDMRESAFVVCFNEITVGPLCPATESNFTLSSSKEDVPLWMAWDGSESDSSIITLTKAGNCPTFSSTVNLTVKAENTGITDNGTLVFTPVYANQITNRRRAYYDSEVPNSSTARDSLNSSTYTEGAEISFRRRVQGSNSIEPYTSGQPERIYSFQICGVASGRPESCTSLQLQVGGTEPEGPPEDGGTTSFPQFEEF